MLPMDAYRVLGVNRAASRETCLKASEKLLSEVADVGYTQEMILSRALVLEATTNVLVDYNARRAYDRSSQIEIPYTHLPGAFALMQEAGDVQPVIRWAKAWLEDNGMDWRAKDVALTAALAHCDLAAYWLEEKGKDKVRESSLLLKAALDILQQYRAALELQADIAAAHEELQAQVALELVGLELSAVEERSEGLQALPSVLWEDGAPVQRFPRLKLERAAFLQQLRKLTTPAEQAALYNSAPSMEAIPVKERYTAAVACIAEGVAARKPALISAAHRYLLSYHQAAPELGEEAMDVRVELAVCKLLLGRRQEAESALCLHPDSQQPPDPAVQEFVQAQAGEDGDLLPGMLALAQSWLDDVAFTSFRRSSSKPADLNTWFTTPQVTLYLKSRGVVDGVLGKLGGTGSLVGRGARIIRGSAVSAAIASWRAVKGLVPERIPTTAEEPLAEEQRSAAASDGAGSEAGLAALPPLDLTSERAAVSSAARPDPLQDAEAAPEAEAASGHRSSGKLRRAIAASALPEPQASAQPVQDVELDAAKQESVGALVRRYAGEPAPVAAAPMKLGGAAAGVGTGGGRPASGREPAADSDDGVVEAWGAASSIPPLEPSGPAMLPLDIERDMWQSFAAVRQRRAIRLAKITLGMAAFAVGMLAWKKPEALRPANIAAVVTAPGRAAVGWVQETLIPPGPPLAVEDARSLVLRWQAIKASALGGDHEVDSLDGILGERMLQAWKLRANALRKDQRHWRYDLREVTIDRVETSRDGKRALVEATLTEGGELLAADGGVIDSYRATFTQEYEMRLCGAKGWRLVASKLVF
ncbi:probable protein ACCUMULATION AND REPLICATION OF CHLOROPLASTS 6, chloroplastic [Coccomyxa sp. Obi]|nr:probable protein ACCUMULATION AND REPLICATION OF CHLOROPLASTS 6, chloroplastic [Coccomyxa sp. Obi]